MYTMSVAVFVIDLSGHGLSLRAILSEIMYRATNPTVFGQNASMFLLISYENTKSWQGF